MAIRITRIDDIDGSDGAEAICLELDKTAYEIDLCPRNKARLFRVIRPFIEHARALDSDVATPVTSHIGDSGRRKDVLYEREVPLSLDQAYQSEDSLDLIAMAREVQD